MADTNMAIYNQLAATPPEAKREINAGRLKGMTDINPMYRIKRLTEVFGPAGFGWNTINVRYTTKVVDNEELIFCELGLVYKIGDKWSEPVYGCGGNKVVVQERNGAYHNDEAYKMAYTDAISVACKSLGMCSDVYFAKDRTKYDLPSDEAQRAAQKPQTAPQNAPQAAQTAQQAKAPQKPVTVEKTDAVPAQPAQLTPAEMMENVMKKLGVDRAGFVALRKKLIDDGSIIPKDSKSMTQADWDNIYNKAMELTGR